MCGSAITRIPRRRTCSGRLSRSGSASPMSRPRRPIPSAATSVRGRESQVLGRRGRAAGRGQHLPQAQGPRRADDGRARRSLRAARTVHRRRRLSRPRPATGSAPHRHGGDDAAGRQARELPPAGRCARQDRAPGVDHRHRRRRAVPAGSRFAIRPAGPGQDRLARRTAAVRDAATLRERRASTPGRDSARPMALPISRRRRPACLSWRRTSRACPASCAMAAPGY